MIAKEKYNRIADLYKRTKLVIDHRCPDAKKGCLVAHSTETILEKLQEILNEQIGLYKEITQEQGSISDWKMKVVPKILNDAWIINSKK